MSEPEFRVVQVSAILGGTPEGQYRMDRLQMASDALDREIADAFDATVLERLREAEYEFIFGTGDSGGE